MKLSRFEFKVPETLIAKYPLNKREDSRLMVVDRKLETIDHFAFKDLPTFFEAGDTLVLNDSKVPHARLEGYKEKNNSKIDMLLLRELSSENHLYDVWIDPARKIRVGNKLFFGGELVAEVIDNTTSRGRTVKFSFDGDAATLQQIFEEIGEIPIPKVLKRKVEPIDRERYHCVYAQHNGSLIAPYAGFHFTSYMLKYLALHDIHTPKLTHHLGINTRKSLQAEELSKYRIHLEKYHIPEETAAIVNNAMHEHKRICAVGTSTLKALESAISYNKDIAAGHGDTSKFFYPPCTFNIANALLTNFHLPRSIDFVNVLAFAGHELAMEAYEIALEDEYRFFAYGDAMLIL